MKNIIITFVFATILSSTLYGQIDSTLLKQDQVDSVGPQLNMDAVYNRPFIQLKKAPVSLGGYMEFNWQHLGTDGVSEGHQFQARRLTLFVSSSIASRIKFLTEIELEEGGKSIAIEFASVDFEFHPLFNARAGIIMNPIGAFNQNHDGPKWEFTDRPISATQLLPATWSNAGIGIYGKYFKSQWMLGYELYLSGGFNNSIIDNEENRTFLPASKGNADRFEEGNTLLTAKTSVRHQLMGELGISYMGGIYNNFEVDGLVLEQKRKVHVLALDYNITFKATGTFITGEWNWVSVDIPSDFSQQFGSKQIGGFLDIVQPIVRGRLLGWEKARLNATIRLEYVDWNRDQFVETNTNIGDQLWSVMPAISFRPSSQSVIRLNYRIQRQQDFLANPAARTGGFIFGISTYF